MLSLSKHSVLAFTRTLRQAQGDIPRALFTYIKYFSASQFWLIPAKGPNFR